MAQAWNEPKEKSITDSIIRLLKKCKPSEVTKMHGTSFSRAGMPDIFWLHSGQAVFIEVKVPGEKPTKLQEKMMANLSAAGGFCYVAWSKEDAKRIIEKHAKKG